MINRIRQIKSAGLTWMHVTKPGELEIQFLRDNFEFHPLDLQDCVNTAQRPKIDVYDKYIFLTLLFPYYDRREREIRASELNFFIGPDFLITVTDSHAPTADRFFDDCLKSQVLRDRYITKSSAQLLHELMHRLQDGIFPMLDHVSEDIENIEKQIFVGAERRMVHDILLIKRNIVNFRRIMNAHRNTIRKLMNVKKAHVFSLQPEMLVYFDNVLDRTKDIWEILENQKETIYALHETNEALISFKLNDIMKMLTAISVSMLPATLLASIFGMNTVRSMPFVTHPFGFWILLFGMFVVMITIVYLFKKKDWL